MKNIIAIFLIMISFVVITASHGSTQLKPDAIDAVRLSDGDIPDGYMYGKIPAPYRSTLKDNPWTMDRPAIKRLADKVFPGGDYNKIAGMHVSIIANKKTPFGDDIVCYIILFKDMKAATDQIKKLAEFVGFNRDRALLLTKQNLAVILFVDDLENFHYIRDLAGRIDDRLKSL